MVNIGELGDFMLTLEDYRMLPCERDSGSGMFRHISNSVARAVNDDLYKDVDDFVSLSVDPLVESEIYWRVHDHVNVYVYQRVLRSISAIFTDGFYDDT